MIVLSPSKLISTAASQEHGGTWFRLACASDGLLCLESISDVALQRSGSSAEWAFYGEVPPYIAKRLTDINSPDQVAQVLDRAIRVFRCA